MGGTGRMLSSKLSSVVEAARVVLMIFVEFAFPGGAWSDEDGRSLRGFAEEEEEEEEAREILGEDVAWKTGGGRDDLSS